MSDWIFGTVNQPELREEFLFEECGLSEFFVRLKEVAKSDANQAELLSISEADAFSQRQRNARQFLAGRRGRAWGVTAGENPEFGGLKLEHHRSANTRFSA